MPDHPLYSLRKLLDSSGSKTILVRKITPSLGRRRALLAAARAFAEDAVPLKDEFVKRNLPRKSFNYSVGVTCR